MIGGNKITVTAQNAEYKTNAVAEVNGLMIPPNVFARTDRVIK